MAIVLVLAMVFSAVSMLTLSARTSARSNAAGTPSSAREAVAATVPAPDALSSRTLKIGWIAMAIGTTNPIQITLDDEYPVVYNVYSTLITYDSQYHYRPDLAQTWRVYNSTAYEMYLTPTAFWTNPANPADRTHPVTGYDVKWSYETFSKNVKQMALFTDYVREIRSVWVDPANQFHIIIDFKIPYAPAMETFGTMFILPQYIWEPKGLAYSNPLPVGSGPFMVRPDPNHPDKMLKPPPILYLDRNPNWHGPSALGTQIFPSTVEIDSYTTSAAMSQDLVLGVIDTIMSPEPTEWVYYLADKPGIIRQSVPHAFVAEVGINLMTPALRATNPQRFRGTNSPLLQYQVVRDAIQMSVNRQKMIDNALLGLGEKADTLVPSVSPWHYDFPDYASTPPAWSNYSDPLLGPYTANEEYPDNTDAPGMASSTYLARALLMKEGWKYTSSGAPAAMDTVPLCKAGGADCLVFRFYTLSDVNWWKTAADGMVADAAKSGIQLNLALYGTTQMNNQIWWPMDYDIWLWDWMFTPAADPSTGILSVETCENLVNGSANDNGFCLVDPNTGRWVYDDLFNQSIRVTDPAARRALTDEMQSILYKFGGYSLPFYRREIYAMNEVRWTHWGDWATNPALPEDVGLNSLLGGQVWPVDHKPPQVPDLPPYQGVVNESVQFSVVATDPKGIPLKYSWDFDGDTDTNGDGIFANDNQGTQNTVTAVYATAGTYKVVLRVSEDPANPNAEWFTEKATTVTILAPGTGSPVVTGLTYSPQDPALTDPAVDFSAAAYDPAGLGISYTWSFGDGATAGPLTVPIVSHNFVHAGIYQVNVTVTSTGGSAERSTFVEVIDNLAPVVQPLPSQQVDEGNLVTLTAFASDPNARDLLDYSWDFGDGSPVKSGNPVNHTYGVQGGSPTPYTVTVTVQDSPGGHTVTASTLITAIPRGPDQAPAISTFSASPDPGTTTQDISFTLSAADPEGDPLHWSLDFNYTNKDKTIDWSTSTPQTRPGQSQTQTAVWRYATSGTYKVWAYVDDLVKWNTTLTYTIIISANTVPTLTPIVATPSSPIPNEPVTLSSTSVDGNGDTLSYQWSYGDGAYASGTTGAYGGPITTTHAYADLGNKTVVLTVDDGKGGTAERQLVVSVVQANRAPTVSSITAPHYALTGATVDFSASVDDLNGDTLAYIWDFGDSQTETGNTAVPATLVAHHAFATENTFHVTLTVDDGNGGNATASVDVIVSNSPPADTTPPVTTRTLDGTLGSGGWYTTAVTVTLTATDDMSTVPWTNYSLDSGPWTPYTAPFAITADGAHTLDYNSTDSAGNAEATNSATVKIDKTSPTASDSESGTPIAGWYTAPVTVTLTADDGTSGVASLQYSVDGGGWQTYSAPFDITAEGRHSLDYRVTDNAGWTSAFSVAINIDLTAPVTTSSIAGTLGSAGWYTSTATVTLNRDDPLSGVAETGYRVDGGAWQTYSAPFDITPEGAHTLEYNSTDVAGHAEATNTVSVDIDTVAPMTAATLSGTLTGGWYTTAVTITLAATDGTSGIGSTRYRLDAGAWSTYSNPVVVSGEGSHTFDFNSTDVAGNMEAMNTASFDVDPTGPTTMVTLSGTVGSNGWYTSSVGVTLAATDAGSGLASTHYRLDGGTWIAYATAFTVSGEGTHTVEYNSTDVAGNDETTKTSSVRIDLTAPTASLTPSGTSGTNGWYRSLVSASLVGVDTTSGVATLEYRIDGAAWQTYTAAFNVPDGTHTVEYRATDAAGLVSAVGSTILKVDATAPTGTLTPTGTAGTNGWYRSTVSVALAGVDATSGVALVEYRLDAAAWQTYTAAFSVPEGTHTVDYRVTDNAGSVSTVQTTTVKVDATAPVLSNLAPTGTVTSGSVTVSWTGADAGSGIAEYQVSVDGGTFQTAGTATSMALTLAEGDHTITVKAIDAAGNSATSDLPLTVSTPVQPAGIDTMTMVLIVVLVVATAVAAIWFLRLRKEPGPPEEPPVAPPEP